MRLYFCGLFSLGLIIFFTSMHALHAANGGVYGQITNFTNESHQVLVKREPGCARPSLAFEGSIGSPGSGKYADTILDMWGGNPSYVDGGYKIKLGPLQTLCVYACNDFLDPDSESIEFYLDSGARCYVINPGDCAAAHGKLYPSNNKTANYALVYVDPNGAPRAKDKWDMIKDTDKKKMYLGIVPAVNLTVTNDCGITFHFSHGDGTGGLYWTDWVKEKSAATEFNCVPLGVHGYNYESGVYEMQNPLTGNIVKNGSLFLIVSSFSGKQVYASLNFNQIGKGFDMKDGTVDPPYWGPDAKQYSLRAKSSMTYSVEKQADGTYTKNLNIHFRDPWTKL